MPYRNAPLHPFLRLIYAWLRYTAKLGILIFYRRRLLLGREHLRFDGPAIVIVNHPNTLMDVLVPGVHIRQEMFFLANYGLFKNPVSGWLLRRLFCIPVKRREDVAEGEARDLDATFEQCYRHLEKNGVLFIAAEGTSWMNRFVRPLKTGTARIGFGTEARNDWQAGVKIIPIGLSYPAPNLFRSTSVVQVGAPVWPRDFREAWQKDHESAVDGLTHFLEEQLKSLTIHTRDEAGELLTGRLETLLHNSRPLPLKEDFYRSQALTRDLLDDAPLTAQTDAYFDALGREGLHDAGLVAAARPNAGLALLARGAVLLAGLPFFAAGYLFWFLPCWLPAFLNRKMNLYIGYSSTVKILTGFFTFPLALWGAYKGLKLLLPDAWLAFAALLTAFPLGLLAERWLDAARQFGYGQKARAFARRQPGLFSQLLRDREAILARLP